MADRSQEAAYDFIADLARRIPERPQITTDGLPQYVGAIARSFRWGVHFAQLIKVYDADRNTPAMAAGVADLAEEIVGLLADEQERSDGERAA